MNRAVLNWKKPFLMPWNIILKMKIRVPHSNITQAGDCLEPNSENLYKLNFDKRKFDNRILNPSMGQKV